MYIIISHTAYYMLYCILYTYYHGIYISNSPILFTICYYIIYTINNIHTNINIIILIIIYQYIYRFLSIFTILILDSISIIHPPPLPCHYIVN